MSSCCSLRTSVQGPCGSALGIAVGREGGWEGHWSSPLMLLPHIKAISISHVESVHCNTDFLHLTHITRVNLFLFAFKNIYLGKKIKEEEKKKKRKGGCSFVWGVCGTGISIWLSVAMSRQCRARPGGAGLCSGQTGREPRRPDGTRDNSCLSRHHYLLQRVTGTSQRAFSRESHTQLLGAPRFTRGTELVVLWPPSRCRHRCLLVGTCLCCRAGALLALHLQPPRSLARLSSGHVRDEQILLFHIFAWFSYSWLTKGENRKVSWSWCWSLVQPQFPFYISHSLLASSEQCHVAASS